MRTDYSPTTRPGPAADAAPRLSDLIPRRSTAPTSRSATDVARRTVPRFTASPQAKRTGLALALVLGGIVGVASLLGWAISSAGEASVWPLILLGGALLIGLARSGQIVPVVLGIPVAVVAYVLLMMVPVWVWLLIVAAVSFRPALMLAGWWLARRERPRRGGETLPVPVRGGVPWRAGR